MSLPPSSRHGQTVQANPFHMNQIAPGIDSIVQLEIKVKRYGHVSKVKVLSGDAEFIEDAKAYVRAAHFPAMPNDPRLAIAERRWPVEVAFFTPKTN
jgi:outer membrane biosynthesis protein TonB